MYGIWHNSVDTLSLSELQYNDSEIGLKHWRMSKQTVANIFINSSSYTMNETENEK